MFSDRKRARISCAAAALLLAGLWLLAHPYRGMVHDARLYAGQAFSRLYPAAFSGDLFFLPGSQEEFSLFSRIYAPLIRNWGLDLTAMLLLGVAHLMWILGAVRLVRALVENNVERYAMLGAMFALPSWYGGHVVWRYAEGFLTPRVFAEAAVLHALALLQRGRTLLALAVVALSGLFHPLYALGGGVVVLVYLCLENRKWLLAAVAALAVALILGLVGPPPFNRLFARYDPAWFEVVLTRNALVFPGEWPLPDWSRVLLHGGLIAAASVWLAGRARRLYASILLTAAVLLMTSLVAQPTREILITQLQTWRIYWLLAAGANAATGFLVMACWKRTPSPVLLSSLIALTWLWLFYPEVSLVLLGLSAAAFVWQSRHPEQAAPRDLSVLAATACAVTLGGLLWYDVFLRIPLVTQRFPFLGPFEGMEPQAALLCALISWALFRWTSRLKPAVALALSLCLASMAAIAWDRRDPWLKWVEAASRGQNPLSRALAPSDQVMWIDSLAETWFLLHRPSFFDFNQGAGVLFSRNTALAYKTRAHAVRRLDPRDQFSLYPGTLRFRPIPPPARDSLASTCAEAPGLAAVISGKPAPDVEGIRWTLPVPKRSWEVDAGGSRWMEKQDAVYLYRCTDLVTRPSK